MEYDWIEITKYINGEMSDSESDAFEQSVRDNPELGKIIQHNRKLTSAIDSAIKSQQFNEDNAYESIRHFINTGSKQSVVIRIFGPMKRYAAILIVALLLGLAGYWAITTRSNPPDNFLTENTTSQCRVIHLPDGTNVTLNSNSHLTFPKEFNGKERKIEFDGEAFFDVAHNPQKPFIIHTGNTEIKVVGTSFNVNAYQSNPTVEVVVETGKVLFNSTLSAKTVVENQVALMPGEKGKFLKSKNTIEKTENKDHNFLSWKTHNFVFDKTPLSEFATTVGKAYQVNIQLDKGLEDLKLTASFENRPLDFILDVVKLTFNLDLSKNQDSYFFQNQKMND